ncbi:MAG: sulfite exporter TauE/SafE family protein [Gammaproteobacteria bacterium]|nr:sulfite exporter TauE/SafE family protein [Gammaproteobacteria bacterium]MDH3971130.1 sulfite exporter TauE/SafE family protein [Gammaproteobacteria bacterium]
MIALNPEPLLAAFLVGLLGGTHCFGMCGGIVGALSSGLSLQLQTSRWRLVAAQLAYNGGRISSYVFAGVLLGLFGQQLGEAGLLQGFPLGRIIGGVVMILFGIYLAGWWQSLLWLEKAGAHLWKYIEPFGRRYIPVRSAAQAFLLGLVWGWLPCGMVYAVLALALASGSGAEGGLLMLAFGLGTLPALLSIGLAYNTLNRFIRDPRIRLLAGVMVIVMGILMLLANPSGHGHHSHPL